MFIYRASVAGKYHIQNGIPNQDSYSVLKDNGVVFAAVADGLGSCKHSDRGSRLVADTVTKECSERLRSVTGEAGVFVLLKDAFSLAKRYLAELAESEGHAVEEYETTLCLVIYKENDLYYANIGDSGCVALGKDGVFRQITTSQRDESGAVFSLSWSNEKLEIGHVKNISAFVLATDGIYDQLCPVVLNRTDYKVDSRWAKLFMNFFPRNEKEKDEMDETEFSKGAEEWLRDLPVDDDKTFLCLLNLENAPEEIISNDDEIRKKYEEIDALLKKCSDGEAEETKKTVLEENKGEKPEEREEESPEEGKNDSLEENKGEKPEEREKECPGGGKDENPEEREEESPEEGKGESPEEIEDESPEEEGSVEGYEEAEIQGDSHKEDETLSKSYRAEEDSDKSSLLGKESNEKKNQHFFENNASFYFKKSETTHSLCEKEDAEKRKNRKRRTKDVLH